MPVRRDLFRLLGFLPPKNDHVMMLLFRCVVTLNVGSSASYPAGIDGSGILETADHSSALIHCACGSP